MPILLFMLKNIPLSVEYPGGICVCGPPGVCELTLQGVANTVGVGQW